MRGVVVLVALLLSGCATTEPTETASLSQVDGQEAASDAELPDLEWQAPTWAAGNVFERDVDIDVVLSGWFEVDGERENEAPYRESGAFRTRAEIISTAFVHDGDPLYLAALWVDGEPAGLGGFRQADLQPLEVTPEGPGCPQACVTVEGLAFSSPTYSDVRFPLAPGNTWAGEIVVPLDEFTDMRMDASAVVGAPTVTSGPEGDVEAMPVVHTLFADLAEMEQQIREDAESEGMEDVSVEAAATGNYETRYADALKTSASTVDQAVVTSDTEFSYMGSQAKFHFKVDTTIITELVAASFDEGEDLSEADVLRMLNGPIAFDIVLEADGADANAAAGEARVFTAARADGGAIPEGHRLEITLKDAEGLVVASGGGRLEHVFDAPGAYVVAAQAIGPDGVVAAAGLEVPVRYAGDFEATCEPVGVAELGLGCSSVTFPVASGATGLAAAVTAGDESGEADAAALVLTAPDGTTYEGPDILLGAKDLQVVGDWVLSWDPEVAVLPSATYHVDVRHGGGEPSVQVEDDAEAMMADIRSDLRAAALQMHGVA